MEAIVSGPQPAYAPGTPPPVAAPDVVPRLRTSFRVLAVLLATLHAWIATTRQSMNADGLAYLEIGEAYFRGDWAAAVNTVWSPLYALILGAATAVVRPDPASEFTLVHIINAGIFLVALACFEYFWSSLGRLRLRTPGIETEGSTVGWPDWAWVAIGYTLFLWTTLALVAIWAVTPDMLTAGLVLLAAGLLVRLGMGEQSNRTLLAFGGVLGTAYLAKAVMFPLAFVFLAVGWVVSGSNGRAARRLGLAAFAFLLIAAPYVTLLSVVKDRPTFGDAGRITYLRYANGVAYPHWRETGRGAATGVPLHPPRRLHDDPAVFAFAGPVAGSYPLSYDPSYWFEGVSPRLEPRMQLTRLIESGRFYLGLLLGVQGAVAAIVCLLSLLSSRSRDRHIREAVEWAPVTVAVAAFGAYALVYVEARYLGPFLLLMWGGLLARVRLPAGDWAKRLLDVSAATILLFLTLALGAFHLEGLVKVAGLAPPSDVPARHEAPAHRPVQMAADLARLGIGPGHDIAYIGDAFDAFFVRPARLRVVAEIPSIEAGRFWALGATARADLLQALRETGAHAVIADRAPPVAPLEGWERVGESRHYIYRLR